MVVWVDVAASWYENELGSVAIGGIISMVL